MSSDLLLSTPRANDHRASCSCNECFNQSLKIRTLALSHPEIADSMNIDTNKMSRNWLLDLTTYNSIDTSKAAHFVSTAISINRRMARSGFDKTTFHEVIPVILRAVDTYRSTALFLFLTDMFVNLPISLLEFAIKETMNILDEEFTMRQFVQAFCLSESTFCYLVFSDPDELYHPRTFLTNFNNLGADEDRFLFYFDSDASGTVIDYKLDEDDKCYYCDIAKMDCNHGEPLSTFKGKLKLNERLSVITYDNGETLEYGNHGE